MFFGKYLQFGKCVILSFFTISNLICFGIAESKKYFNAKVWSSCLKKSAFLLLSFFILFSNLNLANAIVDSEVVTEDVYTIFSALDNNKVVDIQVAAVQRGVPVQIYESNKSAAQAFYIFRGADDFYQIKALCSGKMLDVQDGKKEVGTKVQQYKANNTSSQKWSFEPAGNGYFYIKSKVNGLNLDVPCGKPENGTQLWMYTPNESDAQKFRLQKIPLKFNDQKITNNNKQDYQKRLKWFRDNNLEQEVSIYFGVEIEFTGITRNDATAAAAEVLGNKHLLMSDFRQWRIVYDPSFATYKRVNGGVVSAGGEYSNSEYSCELVSPKLHYRDIYVLNDIVRAIEKKGAFVVKNTAFHVHVDGKEHTPESLKNFCNIIFDKQDLLIDLLGVSEHRVKRFAKKFTAGFIKKLNNAKTFKDIEKVWYEGFEDSPKHIKLNKSRYRLFNLHCFFHGNDSVELRPFRSTLKVNTVHRYILLSLILNEAALTGNKSLCSTEKLKRILTAKTLFT